MAPAMFVSTAAYSLCMQSAVYIDMHGLWLYRTSLHQRGFLSFLCSKGHPAW